MDSTLISKFVLSIQTQNISNDLHFDNPNDFDASIGRVHRFQVDQRAENKTLLISSKSERFRLILNKIMYQRIHARTTYNAL